MMRRYHLSAIVALLLIPVVTMLGTASAIAINPEIAAGHPDYVRNFGLLMLAKRFLMLSTVVADGGLWLSCGVFMLKAKGRSFGWLPLAILGPLGLALFAMLGDPTSKCAEMRPIARATFEISFFLGAWTVAYQAMVIWRDLTIARESWTTGVPIDVIIDQQNASSGMWAFGEGLEVMFLAALFYLLRPVGFFAAARLGEWLSAGRAHR